MNSKRIADADLLSLAEAGVPYVTIGEHYGITRQAVYKRARRAGITRNPNKGIVHLKDPEARRIAETKFLRRRAEQAASEAARLLTAAAQIEAGS